MPRRPLRPCTHPGCPALTAGGPCPAHLKQRRRASDVRRGPDRQFYGMQRWRDLRELQLSREPLCRFCLDRGLTVVARVADHVIDRKERPDLAFDPGNLRSLCEQCHNQRTARDHGFGRGDGSTG